MIEDADEEKDDLTNEDEKSEDEEDDLDGEYGEGEKEDSLKQPLEKGNLVS